MILFLLGSPPQPLHQPSPLQRKSQPSDRPSQAELLQAIADLCEAHEESGLSCAGLNAAYLHAKRLLQRVH